MKIYTGKIITEFGNIEIRNCFRTAKDMEDFAKDNYKLILSDEYSYVLVTEQILVDGGEAQPAILKKKDKIL